MLRLRRWTPPPSTLVFLSLGLVLTLFLAPAEGGWSSSPGLLARGQSSVDRDGDGSSISGTDAWTAAATFQSSTSRARGRKRALQLRGGSTAEEKYSFSLTAFSPKGSLPQLEYALNAVSRGTLSLAIKYKGGVVLASPNRAHGSPLVRESGTKKITHISESIALCYAGLAADSRVLAANAQSFCLAHEEKFGKEGASPFRALTEELASTMQQHTQMGGVRPFGVSLLVAGVEDDGDDDEEEEEEAEDGTLQGRKEEGAPPPKEGINAATAVRGAASRRQGKGKATVFLVQPSGHVSPWNAVAIGQRSGEAERFLESKWRPGMGRDQAVQMAIDVVMDLAKEEGHVKKAEHIDVACVELGRIINQPHLSSGGGGGGGVGGGGAEGGEGE